MSRNQTRGRFRTWPVAVLVVAFSTPLALAQTTVWQGSTANWGDASNWSAGVPDSGSTAQFALPSATALATTNNLSGLSVNGLQVTSSAAGPVSVGGNPFSVQTAIDVAARRALTITSGLGTLSSPSNVVKTGSGTLTLSGATGFISDGQLQGGILNVNTTLNGAFSTDAGTTFVGTGLVTGSLTVNGNVTAGTGPGATTLAIGGAFSANDAVYTAKLFGTGYTNPASADISKIEAAGFAVFNSPTLQLDLSALSAGQVAQLRADTFASGGSRDYFVISSAAGVTGTEAAFSISDLGEFANGEWTYAGVSGGDVAVRFTPVPEPASCLLVCGAATLAVAGFRPRRLGHHCRTD